MSKPSMNQARKWQSAWAYGTLAAFVFLLLESCSPKQSPQLRGGCHGQKINNHTSIRKFLY